MSGVNVEKLAKLQSQVRIGGKGTPRRKTKKVHKSAAADDKKLQSALKKMQVQTIPQCEEVNMFQQNGRVLHFQAPKVQASLQSNVFTISGHAQDKELTELIPGILTQLGPDAMAQLRKFAESYQAGGAPGAPAADDDDDVPDLVENFEDAAKA